MAGLVQQDSQAVGMEQGGEFSKGPRLSAAEMQVEELKNQIAALNSQQKVDTEAFPAIGRKIETKR